MATPPIHDRIVDRLLADAGPVRRLWPPHRRLAVWLALEVPAFWCAVVFGLRTDLGAALRRPLFLLELALWLTAGVIAGAVAMRSMVPGRVARREMTYMLLLSCAAVALAWLGSASAPFSGWGFLASGLRCVASIVAFAALPWTALFVAARRGAPLDGGLTGTYAGVAALLFAVAAVRIACPIDEKLHLLAWHTMPIVIGATLSGVAGARWLEARTAIRAIPAGG